MKGTKREAAQNGESATRTPPVYASKIRELRSACSLTQSQFAGELKAARISVARWETGARVPGKQNYLALAEMAGRKGLESLKEFFSSEIVAKQRSREKKIQERDALRSLRDVEQRWEAGDEEATRLLTLAAIDAAEYAKEQLAEIMKARQELENGEFSARLTEIANQASRVDQLRTAIALKTQRRMEKIDRQVNGLLARRKEIVGASEALRREIGQVSLAWKEAKEEGPDLIDNVMEPITSWSRRIERKLARLKEKEKPLGQKEARARS